MLDIYGEGRSDSSDYQTSLEALCKKHCAWVSARCAQEW